MSILCSDSGNNFEDFERCISNQRNIVVLRLIEWLNSNALAVCRKTALVFSHALFSKLQTKQDEKDDGGKLTTGHSILCREWEDKSTTYGIAIGDRLIAVYEESNTLEEKQNILKTLNALINLSPSAKTNAIQNNVIQVLVMKLKDFGHKYFDASEASLLGRNKVIERRPLNLHYRGEFLASLLGCNKTQMSLILFEHSHREILSG